MLGDKLYKSNYSNIDYATMAIWCNDNNCYIVDKDDYYEIVAREEPDIATLKYNKYLELKNKADETIYNAIKSNYAQGEIDTFQQQYDGAIDIINGILDSKSALFVTNLATLRSSISNITITPVDLANKIITNYTNAEQIILNTLAKRQGLSDYLYSDAVNTKEQINAIVWK